MTIPEVKQVLRAAREAGLEYKRRKAKAAMYTGRLEAGKSVRYSDSGKCEHNSNTVEINLCTAADYETESDEAAKALTEPYIKAGRLIYLVRDNKQREILNDYYLLCRTWQEIADKQNCSRQWIYKLHGYALKKISEST